MLLNSKDKYREMQTESNLLTIAEAAKIIRRSKQRMYEIIHAREIRYVKDGRNFLIPISELDAWIARKLKQSSR